MENLGYYNGKFGPLEEMQVPMLDRVCFSATVAMMPLTAAIM